MTEKKERTSIELEDQMFQLRRDIETYEDKQADLRKWQAELDEHFDYSQFQLRQLHHYDMSQADVNLFSDIMQRQSHLHLLLQEENDKQMKGYKESQESLEAELTDMKKTYNELFENKKS